jgi:hypothetical protein
MLIPSWYTEVLTETISFALSLGLMTVLKLSDMITSGGGGRSFDSFMGTTSFSLSTMNSALHHET